ncbi:MAG TPA: RNA 2',3'-cyclic phosphodiesterase [Clostridia bacterium]|nr:RNA 2',3'-cyclic phosphodiesterase [Clostridia bacterium]
MRVFYGIQLPQPVREALQEATARVQKQTNGRFVLPRSYHCTLAFVGEVETGRRSVLERILKTVAESTPGCDLSLTAPGFFGKPGHAVLWHGLAGAEPLAEASAALRQALRAANLPYDDKPFRPHITLAREARMEACPLALAQARPVSWRAESLTLFESRREAAGMVYAPLASCPMRLSESH